MIVGGLSPLNRVHEILQRMIDNPRHIESLKTCCGVLAILSRDEANKQLIARDGVRLICNIMDQHIERHDLLEAACDLLWSLAFNNTLLKEVIGQQGAIPVILRGMNLHPGVADFLKSACGALSNMCQNPANQSLIAADGGIQCMLGVLEHHRQNVVLLPFVFDALASLIVGNQDNGRRLSEAGAIVAILGLMEQHLSQGELVKSGCHALAILSDNRGEGSKIASAGGVKVLLPVLRMHPAQVDLHRVAAVVLLRMLQEAPVAAEMARNNGVPLMLNVLFEQMNEVETVAAGCHILYSITHAEALKGPPPIDLESQLQHFANSASSSSASCSSTTGGGDSKHDGNDRRSSVVGAARAPLMKKSGANSPGKRGSLVVPGGLSDMPSAGAGTLALVLAKHTARKDVARACVRSVINLSRFPSALSSFIAAGVLEPILTAVSLHPGARDITEGALTMLKLIGSLQHDYFSGVSSSPPSPKRLNSGTGAGNTGNSNGNSTGNNGKECNQPPLCSPLSPNCVPGMLACVKARPGDATAATIIFKHLEAMLGYNPNESQSSHMGSGGRLRNSSPRFPNSSGVNATNTSNPVVMSSWEQEGVKVCLTWARLHSQSASAPSDRAASSASSASSVSTTSNDPNHTSNGALNSAASPNSVSANGVAGLKMGKSSIDAKALAAALSALCRFLQGFASRLPPGLAALRMLDTSTIVRNLEARVRVELNGEIDSEVRRSVNMLLVLLGSPPPPAVSPALAAAAAAAAATSNVNNTGASNTLSGSVETSTRTVVSGTTTPNEGTVADKEKLAASNSEGIPITRTNSSALDGGGSTPTHPSRPTSRAPTPLKLKDTSNLNHLTSSSSTIDLRGSKTSTPVPNDDTSTNNNNNNNSDTENVADSRSNRFTKNQGRRPKGDKSQENARNKEVVPDKNLGCVMVDADLVNLEGYVVSEAAACRCRHGHRSHVLKCHPIVPSPPSDQAEDGMTAPKRMAPKRPRPVHPSEQGMDRTLLWVMPPSTEPISPSNCGDPDSAALLAEENDEPSVRRCHVVYDGCDAAGLGLASKLSVHEPYGVPSDTGIGEGFKHSLTFDACFESGNLAKAIQRGDYEYDLFLRPDVHTEGHMQWFYFAVANTHPPDFLNKDENVQDEKGNGVDEEKPTVQHEMRTSAEAQAMIQAMIASPVNSESEHKFSNEQMSPSLLNTQGDIDLGGKGVDNEEEEEEEEEEDDDLVEITFNVVNLTKPDSLFNHGMQPLMFDCEEAKQTGQGWHRTGYDISYFANNYYRKESNGQRDAEASATYYTLTFTVTFSRHDSTYLLTNSYPYTYSDHKHHLSTLLASSYVKRHMSHAILCQSLAELDCDIITITEDGKDEVPLAHSSGGGAMMGSKRKKCIVITGRVHPGETQASWMMKGVLDFLTGDSPQARLLRSLFVFKIVPMLNPDGVMYGSNRCSLAGCDLNRAWKKPSRSLHPTIYFTKSLIRTEKALRDVVLYIDLHGHSRKMNVFMYGCDDKKKPRPMTRIFPKLLSWNVLGKKYLSFQDCSFSMRKGRESTARVVVAKELGILNSYTLEGTFAGPNFGPLKDMHMNGNHFQEMGHALCDTLLDYYIPNRDQGLLSEEVGVDGIALAGRSAHSSHKHAKPALRRYVIQTETSPASPSSTTTDHVPASPLKTCENDGTENKGSEAPGALKIITADDGNDSPNDEDVNGKDDLTAPPSPEVLAVATDPDGSPSNTKVLQALLSENESSTVRRRQSINAVTGEVVVVDVEPGMEDDECDDIDSGSDNGFDDNNSITEALTPSLDKLRSSDDVFENMFETSSVCTPTTNVLTGAANALTDSQDDADEIEEAIHIQTTASSSIDSQQQPHISFRRHSSSSKFTSSSVTAGTVPPSEGQTAVSYPQMFPAAAPPPRHPNSGAPFSSGGVVRSMSQSSVGSGGGGQAVLLPRSITQRTQSMNSESIWSSNGAGGGGSFWADTVGESGMLVTTNSRKSSLLTVGSTGERPRSGSRYRQTAVGSATSTSPSTTSSSNTLTQLGGASFDVSRGLPSVSLSVGGGGASVNGSGGGSVHTLEPRVTTSRPPRASSLPSTAGGNGGGVSGGGGISISSSRGGPAGSSPNSEGPTLSRGATLNVMRGSLRVRDTNPTLAPGLSPKVGTESMTAAQRLSFRRMNSGQGAPKGASLLNNTKRSPRTKNSRRTGRPGK